MLWYTLAVYLHDLDPFAIGPIRWYGLSYLLGFALGYLIIRRVTRAGISSLDPVEVWDLVLTAAIGIVLGGRIGYVLLYQPSLLTSFSDSLPWWDALAINKGGMASHGGMIGLIVATWLYARRHRHRWRHVIDLTAFGAPIGLFFGRMANFINGELYGRGPTEVPWAVKFPQEMTAWHNSSQGLDRLAELHRAISASGLAPREVLSGSYSDLAWWAIGRIQEGSQGVARVVEPLLVARHPSQLYEALLEGLLVSAVLAAAWLTPRKPGFIGSLFCFTYGIVRIVGEQFRVPDEHLLDAEYAALGITRGQWLSALLMLLGVVGFILVYRSDAPKMGGWRTVADKPERETLKHPPT